MKNFIKRHLAHSTTYKIARKVKWAVEGSFRERDDPVLRVAHLQPQGTPKGNVLLSRANDAFFLRPGERLADSHHRFLEAYEMARILVEMGYSVDVIHHRNQQFIPQKEYNLFIDSKMNMGRLGPLLNKDCRKVFYVVTAHPLVHNHAEFARLIALQQRRGVTVSPRRQELPNLSIEHADCAIIRGNEFTINTYRYAGKPLYWIPLAPSKAYAWPETKSFETCRTHFLWLGGTGMVHKGLDLVLEAFATMPEYELTVCGPVDAELDFVAAYRRELYDTPNIRLAGWVDVTSTEFIEVANRCVALIHPSCSEAGGGAVITCIHAGLIPIASHESSVNICSDWGIILKTSSIEEIQNSVRHIAHLPASKLKQMARSAWEFEQAYQSRENFCQEFQTVISKILSPQGPLPREHTDAASSASGIGLKHQTGGSRVA